MPATASTRRWFRIAYGGNALRRMLDEQGTEAATMTAATGIRVMVDFMAHYRPQHGDSDELWCSWGPRDDAFEFAVSRRMTRRDHPDAAVSITVQYRLTPARQQLVGERAFLTPRDARATAGYYAISRASPVQSRIDEE
ncbi:hypothetical protein BH10ACT7_BH10ACT7_22330 [soil metagenome]